VSTSIVSGRPAIVESAPRIVVAQIARAEELAAALEIRRRVFVEEQQAPDLRISDPDDAKSVIALATIQREGQRKALATGRITLPTRRTTQAMVAWVATLPEARGQGAGATVVRFLLDAADDARAAETVLAAQIHAEAFYRRFGFIPAGPLYDVRGIAHRRMIRPRPLS
jgi:predicted GNAT family N-acyltransferase